MHRILEGQELKIKKGQSLISCERALQHELFQIGAAQYLQKSNLTFTLGTDIGRYCLGMFKGGECVFLGMCAIFGVFRCVWG